MKDGLVIGFLTTLNLGVWYIAGLLTRIGTGRHEWQCPNCGATTRARMADRGE